MFLFNKVTEALFAEKSTTCLVKIGNGKFSYSENGESKIILKHANISIQRASTDFTYELLVQDMADDLAEEASFLVDKALKFEVKNDHFEWIDIENPDARWVYVVDPLSVGEMDAFQEMMTFCMFEREYQKNHQNAKPEELKKFINSLAIEGNEELSSYGVVEIESAESTVNSRSGNSSPNFGSSRVKAMKDFFRDDLVLPAGTSVLSLMSDIGYFDISESAFVKCVYNVTVEIVCTKPFEYYLVVHEKKPLLVQKIDGSMNPYTNGVDNTFTWVELEDGTPKISWCAYFNTQLDLQSFTGSFFAAVFETASHVEYKDISDSQLDYINEAMQDMDVDKEEDEYEREEEDEEEIEDEAEEVKEPKKFQFDGPENETNSSLTVGYKHDQSYVVRGNKIGIFKHTEDDDLEFATTINDIKTVEGKNLSPKKMVLHDQDSKLLILGKHYEPNIHVMDLEYGKVVEEWKVGDYLFPEELVPKTKYAQQTSTNVVLGVASRALFHLDGRLPKEKLVSKSKFQYSTRGIDFTCAATTGQGHVAVGAGSGEIRLFNEVGKRAKTLLPGLGDAILGIDTTEAGRYILATCRNYLMVIDTAQPNGKSSFEGSYKAAPKRLQLKPEHVAWMGHSISFTPARFSTGAAEEKTIITSTGPYVITWNFRRVKLGKIHDYSIKQYSEKVVADNFKYGADRNIIVALAGNVEMTKKSQLQTPTKFLKSRSEFVNSPY